jgi:3-deoxy-D-manno-octulosonic-acid transferase
MSPARSGLAWGPGRPGRRHWRERLYAGAIAVARRLLPMTAPLDAKLARGLAGRRGAVARLEAWAQSGRKDTGARLVWVHAPSVGEGLMAQAIMAELRARAPDLQLAFTHFSPSAERLAADVGADVADYLPWDEPGEVARALAALRPDAIAFVRTEAWPTLTALAQREDVRLLLVNAVLAAGSSRLRAPARYLLGPTYRRLDAVGAVAPEDAARFERLGVPRARVHVTGDARFDQVWRRVQGLRRDEPLLERLKGLLVTTLVAGSTWTGDEERLIPAFALVRTLAARTGLHWRLVIAPHEPTEDHLQALEARIEDADLPCARLADVERSADPVPAVVVVDRVGVLADLYAIAHLAYVGGGFHAAGLHSVVEPAALAVPVLFGPHHGNAREAGELEDAGGGFEVSDVSELQSSLLALSGRSGRAARDRAAAAAQQYVRSRLGGAAANAELILEQLG